MTFIPLTRATRHKIHSLRAIFVLIFVTCALSYTTTDPSSIVSAQTPAVHWGGFIRKEIETHQSLHDGPIAIIHQTATFNYHPEDSSVRVYYGYIEVHRTRESPVPIGIICNGTIITDASNYTATIATRRESNPDEDIITTATIAINVTGASYTIHANHGTIPPVNIRTTNRITIRNTITGNACSYEEEETGVETRAFSSLIASGSAVSVSGTSTTSGRLLGVLQIRCCVYTSGVTEVIRWDLTRSTPAAPNLSITMSPTGSLTAGTTGTYTIEVANSPSAAPTTDLITVIDTLPVGLTFVPSPPAQSYGPGWSCSPAGQVVTCTNQGPLAPGVSVSLTLTVAVTAPAGTPVTNTAVVSTSGKTNSASNTSEVLICFLNMTGSGCAEPNSDGRVVILVRGTIDGKSVCNSPEQHQTLSSARDTFFPSGDGSPLAQALLSLEVRPLNQIPFSYAGVHEPVFTTGENHQSILGRSSPLLVQYVEALRRDSRVKHIDIIGHSLGGVVTAGALRLMPPSSEPDAPKIRAVAVDSPLRGTSWSLIGPVRSIIPCIGDYDAFYRDLAKDSMLIHSINQLRNDDRLFTVTNWWDLFIGPDIAYVGDGGDGAPVFARAWTDDLGEGVLGDFYGHSSAFRSSIASEVIRSVLASGVFPPQHPSRYPERLPYLDCLPECYAWMIIAFQSPGNVLVTDPQGRKIGTDPATGAIVNQIPGARYTGPGTEPQVVAIPNSVLGSYQVLIVGTGVGTYRLSEQHQIGRSVQGTSMNGSITLGERQLATVVMAPNSAPVLSFDTAPPVTTATASSAPNSAGWYKADSAITLAGTDALSGVAKTEYKLDAGAWTTYLGPITISTDGVHMLLYRSVDKAGNQETDQSLTIKLDKTPPSCAAVATPSTIWPPNKKLVDVTVTVTPTDGNGSGLATPQFTLVSVTSNEAIAAADYPGFTPGGPDTTGQLRADRAGSGPGRTYTLTYQVADLAGNRATCTATVNVPHDQSTGVQVGHPPGVSPGSDPVLTATLTARAGCGSIDHIEFGDTGRSFDNARVAVTSPAGGPSGQATGFSYTPPSGTTSVSLTIERVVQSGGATVQPIRFYDGCGEWRTFVGGGSGAFR